MAPSSRTTISSLRACKREKRKFSMLTCYDYATAHLMHEAGVPTILVGDTYGEVCLGHSTTLPVKLDHLLTVTEAVRRGAPDCYLVGDMPYLTYQICPEEAIRNAGRFMADAGCDCVKIEVDRRLAGTVAAMATATIPVMAHLGLKPQSIRSIGGYRIQGRKAGAALAIIEDARLMEEAGAVALLLEAVPTEVARVVAESTDLPVIGIVSGPYCDGQVLVMHDMLGYSAGHPPSSVKQYANLHDVMVSAFRSYVEEVGAGAFPAPENSIAMDPAEHEVLQKALAGRKPAQSRR